MYSTTDANTKVAVDDFSSILHVYAIKKKAFTCQHGRTMDAWTCKMIYSQM